MNCRYHASIAVVLLITMSAPLVADEAASPAQGHAGTGHVAGFDVAAGATDAAAIVERFTAALSDGDLAKAAVELDPDALILESGGAERSAAEYLGGHARSDAAFLRAAQRQLLRRTARASGDLAWVASESELHVRKDGKPVTVLSTETMVLRRDDEGWRIVHIHWSSRTTDRSASR